MGKSWRASMHLDPSTRLLACALVLLSIWPHPALAEVAEVTGSAYGFSSSVSLFDGPAVVSGPAPVVTLPPEGSATPITEVDPEGESAQYGPAIIVQPTTMSVSTEGTAGRQGSVTSSSSVEFERDEDEVELGPFDADRLESTCTATESGATGSATLSAASLVTSTDPDSGEPVETIEVPADPTPNTTFGGTIDDVGDTYRIVLNEQIVEGDTLTVNAVHYYLGQNEQGESVEGVAQGEAIIGQSVCGVASGSGDDDPNPQPGETPTAPGQTTSESGDTNPAGESTTTTPSAELATAGQDADRGSGERVVLVGALVGVALVVIFRLRRPRGQHRR